MQNYRAGLVSDMTNADYHDNIHIGSSGFKLFQRSPLHYWHASALNPNRERREPSRYMLMGTAWHTGIWEPHMFSGTYDSRMDGWDNTTTLGKLLTVALDIGLNQFRATHVAIPDGLSKTSSAGKQLRAELEEQGKTGVEESKLAQVLAEAERLDGKVLLSADDLEAVRAMSDAARQHPATQMIFGIVGGMAEHSIFWVDEETGAPCRIRPDYMLPPCPMFPTGLIVDGKSTDDASRSAFGRNAWNSEMFWQAAFYSDGYQAHFGTDKPPVFAWLAQERDAPFACMYHAATEDFVEYGRRRYRPLLRRFAECLQSGRWPGYPATVEPMILTGYAIKAMDEAA